MKYNEEQKKDIVELFREYFKRNGIDMDALDAPKEFFEHKGIIPKLEAGKWYKSKYGTLRFFTDENNCYGFGEGSSGWSDFETIYSGLSDPVHNFTEETSKEVGKALIAEGNKRGYKKGDNVTTVRPTMMDSWVLETDEEPYYTTANGAQEVYFNSKCVFYNGVWASIVETDETPTEITIAELEKKHGYTNLKIVK